MVQVDVFWSYALGAGFAVAASRQLAARAERKPKVLGDLLENSYFTKTLLFIALLFAPSGIWLLWEYTSWETMHAGTRDLPVWLCALFSITHVTQAIAGFVVAYWLIRRGRTYLAYLQIVLGYFGMFFILVHGWDGIGYQRFFSPTRADLDGWTWSTAGTWLTSDVALTLYGMGVVMLPFLFGMIGRWIHDGLAEPSKLVPVRPGAESLSPVVPVVHFLLSVFVATLGSAIVASLLVHALGWALGAVVAIALITVLGLRRGGFFHWLYTRTLWVPA